MKPTGSLYLHCDPTASHYLKIILDAGFGARSFRNEVIWQRTIAKGNASKRFPNNHDTLLVYGKSEDVAWNPSGAFIPYDCDNLSAKTAEKYSHVDERGRAYQLDYLLNAAKHRPNLTYEYLGATRVWRWTRDRMQKAYENGLIVQTAPGRVPRFKRYLDEQEGLSIPDTWTDINPLNSQARERLGYPHTETARLARTDYPGELQSRRCRTRSLLRLWYCRRRRPEARPAMARHRRDPPRDLTHAEPIRRHVR